MNYHQTKSDFKKNCGPIDDFRSPRILDYLSVDPYCSFGLRKLRAAYDGPFIRMLRESDGVEKDFGAFLYTGEIDAPGIAAFKGASTLRVTRFYDQGKNGLDFVQLTKGNQPVYSENGLLGKPAIYFIGSNYRLDFCYPKALAAGEAYTQFCLGKKDSTTDHLICFGGSGTTYGSVFATNTNSGAIQEAGVGNQVNWNYATHLTDPAIIGSKRTSVNAVTHYVNEMSNASGTLNATINFFYMGYRATLNYFCKGYIAEAYMFLSELSDADRITLRDNINSHFGVY